MNRTRLSLFYPATYLTTTGLGMLLAPGVVLSLFFSTGDYGDVMPRMAGALLIALAILVVQIIRLRLEAIYLSVAAVRVFLCAAWIFLWALSRDPFFLLVFGVVAPGAAWTFVAHRLDRRTP